MSSAERRIKDADIRSSELRGMIVSSKEYTKDIVKDLESSQTERCSDLEKRLEEDCVRPLGYLLQSFAHED
jgi:hypothetical protein